MATGIRDWVSYWDSPHSIYVNARHADIHYRRIAKAIVGFLPGPDARVLDFGCGDALHADDVAAVARTLVLSDAAPNVRKGLMGRFSRVGNIEVLAPEALHDLPNGAFDLIVANSVAQYISRDEFAELLALWRRLLAPSGRLVVADVIPPEVSAFSDLMALLRYAFAYGFLLAALIGVARTALSPYRGLRAQLGIARYSEAAFLAMLSDAGYAARRLPRNIEHNQARMAFAAQPAAVKGSPPAPQVDGS